MRHAAAETCYTVPMHEELAAVKADITAWREARRWSMRRLAQAAGLSETTVLRLEQMPSYNPTSDSWRKLAAALGWDAAVLLGRVGRAPPVAPPQDTVAEFDALLQRAGVGEAAREAILWSVRLALAQVAHPTSGVPR